MKKVVYSVTKYVSDKFTKLLGIGCITDEDLLIACMSKTNKPYKSYGESLRFDGFHEYDGGIIEIR